MTNLTPLYKDICPSPYEISSIEAGLMLRGHKLALGSQLVPVLHSTDGVVLITQRVVPFLWWAQH